MNTRNREAAKRLTEARERLGWTQERLGVAMGYDPGPGQTRVARWETGKTKLSLEDLEAAAEAMGLPIFALLPSEEIDRTAAWIMAAARQRDELLPEYLDQFTQAIETITRALGPLPDASDERGWDRWLGYLRSALLEAQRVAVSDRANTERSEPPANNGQA
jgi:transcriptional regulator with XRE-family HTH domain